MYDGGVIRREKGRKVGRRAGGDSGKVNLTQAWVCLPKKKKFGFVFIVISFLFLVEKKAGRDDVVKGDRRGPVGPIWSRLMPMMKP